MTTTEPKPTQEPADAGEQLDKQKSRKRKEPSEPKAASDRVPKKRGPPRPHRKLAQDLLEARLGKLRRRIEKAKGQLEDAERHIEAYDKEFKYRKADAEAAK